MLHFIRCCVMGWNPSSVLPEMLLQWKWYVLTGFYVPLMSEARSSLITTCHNDSRRNSVKSLFNHHVYIWLLTSISEIYIMLYFCIYSELQCTLKILKVVLLSGTSIQRASRVLFDMTNHCFDHSVVNIFVHVCITCLWDMRFTVGEET